MAHEFVKLSAVDMATSIDDSVNILVEQADKIKRMNIADIPQRAQPDWNETNEASPAYILNKPDLSSVGGGSASITYFIMSESTVKVGDEWTTATDMTKDAVLAAFGAGIVRLKFADNAEFVTTALSYSIPASGSGAVYYVASDKTIGSFTFTL